MKPNSKRWRKARRRRQRQQPKTRVKAAAEVFADSVIEGFAKDPWWKFTVGKW